MLFGNQLKVFCIFTFMLVIFLNRVGYPFAADNSTTQGWSVMRNECSHRSAPLSLGRIDSATGCIECPYHGWQFNVSGVNSFRAFSSNCPIPHCFLEIGYCTKATQSEARKNTAFSPQQAQVASLPVHLTPGMLWALFPMPSTPLASSYTDLPGKRHPILSNLTSYTTRELPYAFDFVLENLFDPTHVPLAHRSLLQSLRSDAHFSPIEAVSDSAWKLSYRFHDLSNAASPSNVSLSFTPPATFISKSTRSSTTSLFSPLSSSSSLAVLVAPVSASRSRIFLSWQALPRGLPKFVAHSLLNRFVERGFWVIGGRRRRSSTLRQSLPTDSDKAVAGWRRWWGKYMSLSPIFLSPARPQTPTGDLSDVAGDASGDEGERVMDRFDGHGKDCKHCRAALRRTKLVLF